MGEYGVGCGGCAGCVWGVLGGPGGVQGGSRGSRGGWKTLGLIAIVLLLALDRSPSKNFHVCSFILEHMATITLSGTLHFVRKPTGT